MVSSIIRVSGNAYRTQAELGKEPVANLERAIATYTEATTIRRQPGLERDLAGTLNNLGNAYRTQAQLGKEPVANLERAIAAYTEATTIHRQPGLERDLAQTLNNLGVAYVTQAELGKEPVANLERAIAALTEATTIRAGDVFTVADCFAVNPQTVSPPARCSSSCL